MSSPTHYKVKAKAIKRILDSPTIVIMSVEGVHLEPTLESVGGQCAGDGAGEEGEERRQHQSRHPATLSANIRQVIMGLQVQIIERLAPLRDLALKSASEYLNSWDKQFLLHI